MAASRQQLDYLINKHRSEPDDALANKIRDVADELVESGTLSPKDAAGILSDL